MVFFQQSSYKKIVKFLKKNGFTISQGGLHAHARNENGVFIPVPRHNKVSSGVVKSITKKLVEECGIDEDEIKKAFK